MIFREKVGELVVEYEGTPEEIHEFMDMSAKRQAEAVQKFVAILNDTQEDLSEEVPSKNKTDLH